MLPPLDHPCKDCGRQRVNDTSPRILGYDIEGKLSAIPDVGDHTVYGTTQSPVLDDETEIAIDNVLWDYRLYVEDTDSAEGPYDRSRNALRSRIVRLIDEARKGLEAEITARGRLYGDMCEILHTCCQKYRLGLGGENIAELVTEEVARLREASLTPEEAHHLLVYEFAPSTIAKLRRIAFEEAGA